MAALRAPVVRQAPSFERHVAALRDKYPEVDECVGELCEDLRSYWTMPLLPVDPEAEPNIYAQKIDYPPLGAEGLGRFLVTYYASELASNPMRDPLRKFMLISITEN